MSQRYAYARYITNLNYINSNMYPGVRNRNLYILANFFLNDGIPEDFAADYLVAYYADSKYGFPASEIRGIVRSAYH